MERLFKHKYYKIGYAELWEKVSFYKKYMVLKRFLFWKSSCSD